MTADIIQARYDQLDSIANRFNQQADNTTALMQQVQHGVDALRQSGWEGLGAAAFLGEMETAVFPVIQRLTDAFHEANTATLTLRDIIRTAEEEAARLFQGSNGAGAAGGLSLPGGVGGGYGFAGAATSGTAPATGQTVPLADKRSSELVAKSPSEIFSEKYMENMIGSHAQGENSPQLNNLMEQALKQMQTNGKVDGALLDQMADLRGVDRGAFRQQYEKFENLWRNATTKGDIDLSRHGDFMGSTASMRYGKVVGDVFGIDPVWGAMLNPTGGLVGPDSNSYTPGPNDAIGYHGIFHDAAGYLYNNHQQLGPGYDYFGRSMLPTSSPLSGQVDGLIWWASHAELSIDIPNQPNFVSPFVGRVIETGLEVLRPAIYVYEGGRDIVDGLQDVFSGNFSEGMRDIGDGVETIVDGAVDIGEGIIDWAGEFFNW